MRFSPADIGQAAIIFFLVNFAASVAALQDLFRGILGLPGGSPALRSS
jgi:hypothetical protein